MGLALAWARKALAAARAWVRAFLCRRLLACDLTVPRSRSYLSLAFCLVWCLAR